MSHTAAANVVSPEVTRIHGFHGTSLSNAHEIIVSGFRLSSNDWDWLGDGVYFFQDAPRRAWDWARNHYPDEPAVLASMIRLDHCMDLVDLGWKDVLADAFATLSDELSRQLLPLPRQTALAHRLDRLVVNLAIEHLERTGQGAISVVRGAFTEGSPMFPGSHLLERTHIQAAVRDLALIESSTLIHANP